MKKQLSSPLTPWLTTSKKRILSSFAGGFSAADEPDGSAKFIVNILLNEKVRAAIDHFIERGGLIIGICNGFQALCQIRPSSIW